MLTIQKNSRVVVITAIILSFLITDFASADESVRAKLAAEYQSSFRSLLRSHCFDCHSEQTQEAKLNLEQFSTIEDVIDNHQLWAEVLHRVEKGEMPPEEADQLSEQQRQQIVDWIRSVRRSEAVRNAGDPGPVTARRLSNSEFDNTIRDLTGVDIRPTREFPVDPANEAGFDNSAESLTMSPALFNKYLAAARHVAEHLVLKPDGFDFASHPVVANTDRDKYCVRRIIDFYQRQPVDLADYLYGAWQFQVQNSGEPSIEALKQIAQTKGLSPKYLTLLWQEAIQQPAKFGPLATFQTKWNELPTNADQRKIAKERCQLLSDWVNKVRRQLAPEFENLHVDEIHKGAQAFVLWKNRQYANHRQKFDPTKLQSASEADADFPNEFVIPNDVSRELFQNDVARFCRNFPDAFFISERGRDYLGKPRDQQEKGRLLSAGFHSMMGYFRDDKPLYDLILNEAEQQELDRLWNELDFIAAAPIRQYSGFLWFERTDSRYMRDPEFDFARPENKDATSEENIEKLAEIYLAKARRNGGEGVAINAIIEYFQSMNRKIRWVEEARKAAQPSHTRDLLEFARRAYRRELSEPEIADLVNFYVTLCDEGISHEEAIQDTIVSILVSPQFLYRVDLLNSQQGTRPLDSIELASRLSYFLWASMPDEELRQLAASGDLQKRDVLIEQTRRMLKHNKVRGLATEFGANWLDFRRFEKHNAVDREHFPEFTDELRQAMFEEPIRFFVDVAQNDRSVREFLDSSHTFVNQDLAEHYGVPFDPKHKEWQRIDVSKQQRGGLLPMSVFLTKNAPGLRTSPVKRGYWVVRRLLGETIPPPPPDVPELPNNEAELGELTLAEALAKHREHQSCAGCHDRFDSIGLAFENFGPIGELRQEDLGGRPIELEVIFPNGQQGDGLEGLKDYLKDHREEEFTENLCRKLLSYGLGRTLLLSDDLLVEEMIQKLHASDDRFGILIETIVTSPQFLNKRGSQSLTKD